MWIDESAAAKIGSKISFTGHDYKLPEMQSLDEIKEDQEEMVDVLKPRDNATGELDDKSLAGEV